MNSNSLKIKVCGLRHVADIQALSSMDIDFMGFIFYKLSPRYAGEILKPEVLENIPSRIIKTGVFVNESYKEISSIVEKYKLQTVQLHGNESTVLCKRLKHDGLTVIKALKGSSEDLKSNTLIYEQVCDYFLIDTPTIQHGGSGQKFDWQILQGIQFNKPIFLSGGIGPEDNKLIKDLNLKYLYAIDINSKFEIAPGLKNITTISAFVKTVKQ